ncbi:MAG: thioredoxin family protein [Planctomycetota bacterium]|nr:thioredoxin family protein [Planctomycetota bacterium]
MLMTAAILHDAFQQGIPFKEFVEAGEEHHQHQWHERHGLLELDQAQAARVESFTRPMKILCLTGQWCGDCALQGAALQRISEAAGDLVELRFIPRSEEFAELIVANRINDGYRVPLTWFMAEDYHPCARFGDRTLSRYRSMARKALGDDAPVIAQPSDDPVREVLGEMLDEVERVQWLLRLSPRLRELHGD